MPKILHRIFFNFDDGPDPFLPFLETWKKELPDFKIMEWNKHNLPLDLNTYTKTLTKEKNHAFLSDYFRCWLLREYGGVYLDADIEILDGNIFRNIYNNAQQNNDYSLFLGVESSKNGKLTAHSMGIKDNTFHPLLSFLMNLYENELSGPLHFALKYLDMPYLMSLYFLNKERTLHYSDSKDGKFKYLNNPIITDGICIYPASYFSPLTTYNNNLIVSSFDSNTCICHHFAATWREDFNGIIRAKTFFQALEDGEYYVDPKLIKELKLRYKDKKILYRKPQWALKEKHVKTIEKVFNKLIPYGSPLFNFFKTKDVNKQTTL